MDILQLDTELTRAQATLSRWLLKAQAAGLDRLPKGDSLREQYDEVNAEWRSIKKTTEMVESGLPWNNSDGQWHWPSSDPDFLDTAEERLREAWNFVSRLPPPPAPPNPPPNPPDTPSDPIKFFGPRRVLERTPDPSETWPQRFRWFFPDDPGWTREPRPEPQPLPTPQARPKVLPLIPTWIPPPRPRPTPSPVPGPPPGPRKTADDGRGPRGDEPDKSHDDREPKPIEKERPDIDVDRKEKTKRDDEPQSDDGADEEQRHQKPPPDPPEKKRDAYKYSGKESPDTASSRGDEPGALEGGSGEPDPIGLRRRIGWLHPSDPEDFSQPDEVVRDPRLAVRPSYEQWISRVSLAFRDPDPLAVARGVAVPRLNGTTGVVTFVGGPNPEDESDALVFDRRFTRIPTRDNADQAVGLSRVDDPWEEGPQTDSMRPLIIDPRNSIGSRTMINAMHVVRTGRLV